MARSDTNKAHTSIQYVENSITPLKNDIYNLQGSISGTMASIDNLLRFSTTTNADINSLKAAIVDAQNNIALVKNNVTSLQSGLSVVQNNVTSVQTVNTSQQTVIDSMNAKIIDNVVAYARWTVSNNQPQLTAKKNITGVGKLSTGEYIFTFSTPINPLLPVHVGLIFPPTGIYQIFPTAINASTVTVKITNIILLTLAVVGADLPGSLIVMQ